MNREQLIEQLSDIRSEYNCFDPMERDWYHALSEAISALQERKTGKWIDSRNEYWMCSECGKWLDILQGDADMNFCPNCGVKMEV